jgi:hypothetical protein
VKLTLVEFPPWVSPTLLGVAVLAGLFAFRALFWDWLRRGRLASTRRCPKCWYDMTGAGLVCPECGKVARRERDLHRSKRHRVWATLLLVLGAAALAARWVDGKSARELAAGLPTDLLLLVVKEPVKASAYFTRAMGANGSSPPAFDEVVSAELWLRDFRDQLSPRQRRSLAARRFAFDPALEIVVRPKWPRGVPMTAAASPLFNGVRPRTLRATSPWPGADVLAERSMAEAAQMAESAARWGRDWELELSPPSRSIQEAPWVIVGLGTPPADSTQAAMDVEVLEGEAVIWSGRVAHPVRLVDSIEEAVPPFEDAGVTAALAKAVGDGLTFDADGREARLSPVKLDAAGVVAAVRLEVVKDGAVLASCSLVAGQAALPRRTLWSWGGWVDPPGVVFGTLEGPGVPLTREQLKGAVVRVTPDPELALRMVQWDRAWKGAFEVRVDPARKPVERW